MISILVPVYKEAPLLGGLLSKLVSEKFKDKEIVVCIDEPSEKSMKLVRKYGKKARFVLSKERTGKAKSMNQAVRNTKGDIILFLDADIKVKSKNFLSQVEREMGSADILDVKKTIIEGSHISKMSQYEFMASNIMTSLFSKTSKCLGFNGVAFAMRREAFEDVGGFREDVISEDFELGMQCYLKNKTYKYSKRIEVSTKSKDNWRDWMVQRRRWSIGNSQFFKMHWRDLAKAAVKSPSVIIMTLFFTWPLLVVSLLLNTMFENFLLFSLLMLSLKFSILFPAFLMAGFGFLFLKNLVIFGIVYACSALIFYVAAKKLNFKYSLKYFSYFYLFYSPLWAGVFFYHFIRCLVLKDFRVSDWKVSNQQ